MSIPKFLYGVEKATKPAKRSHTVDPSDALKASEIGQCNPAEVIGKAIPLDEIVEVAGFRSALLEYGLSLRTTRRGQPLSREINGLPTSVAILCYARGRKPGTETA